MNHNDTTARGERATFGRMVLICGIAAMGLALTDRHESKADCAFEWKSSQALPGLDGSVRAMAVWDDGTGPALYVGGGFQVAGKAAVSNMAKWDGVSWSAVSGPFGDGLNGAVLALAVYDGALIAGGSFTTVAGIHANCIAKWDGNSWSALGNGESNGVTGYRAYVDALAAYDGELVVAGDFYSAGGAKADSIARWNGTRWLDLGAGIWDAHPVLNALTVYKSDLVVGGQFVSADQLSACNIAKWDGSSWSGLGSGANGCVSGQYVATLGVYAGELIVGGVFTGVGGISTRNIARWNGDTWSELDGGVDGETGIAPVYSLAIYDSLLIVGGAFTSAGGVTVNGISAWDGISWSALDKGLRYDSYNRAYVFALAVFNEELIAGGYFRMAGDRPAYSASKWDGTLWSALGGEMDGGVKALCVYNGEVITGGSFTMAGGASANHIARWNTADGGSWSTLGTGENNGVNDAVFALTIHKGKLIAGGDFTAAGGVSASHIAEWDGVSWSALGCGLGSGLYGSVRALVSYNGDLIAAGNFTVAGSTNASGIAKWNGALWSPVGDGVYPGRPINTLTVYNNELIAGGLFDRLTPGGIRFKNLVKWNGAFWSSVCYPSPDYSVDALTLYDDELIIGGYFSNAGGVGVNHIARWNGATCSPLGDKEADGVNGWVYALTTYNDELIVGGSFSKAGTTFAPEIAKWNGTSWSPLNTGVSGGVVHALVAYGPELIAGGDFVTAGGSASNNWARWGPSVDTDMDGVPDVCDACPGTAPGTPVAPNGCTQPAADMDRDGDVDPDDWSLFQRCNRGSDAPPNPSCKFSDLDGDGDVDQSDFGLLQRCLSGPNVPADPHCAD